VGRRPNGGGAGREPEKDDSRSLAGLSLRNDSTIFRWSVFRHLSEKQDHIDFSKAIEIWSSKAASDPRSVSIQPAADKRVALRNRVHCCEKLSSSLCLMT